MMQNIKKNILNINIFVILLSFFTLFFTVDMYSTENITPEFPLLSIAGVPFLRMEFIIIVFSLTMLVGLIIGLLAKSKINIFYNISVFILAFLILLIAVFDVYALQTFFPTLRISHIIMTLSRVVGIISGAIGIFIGISIIKFSRDFNKENLRVVLLSVVLSSIFSILAISNNMYKFVYIILGAFLLITFLINHFVPISKDVLCQKSSMKIFSNISCVLSFGILTFMIFTANSYVVNTLNLSYFTYVVAITLIIVSFIVGLFVNISDNFKVLATLVIALFSLLIAFIQIDALLISAYIIVPLCLGMICDKADMKKPYSIITASIGIVIFSIISYVCVHYSSEVVKYSNNRIIYEMYSINFVIISICVGVLLLTLLSKFIFDKVKYKK